MHCTKMNSLLKDYSTFLKTKICISWHVYPTCLYYIGCAASSYTNLDIELMANHFLFFRVGYLLLTYTVSLVQSPWGADGAALAEQTEVERWDVGLHSADSLAAETAIFWAFLTSIILSLKDLKVWSLSHGMYQCNLICTLTDWRPRLVLYPT